MFLAAAVAGGVLCFVEAVRQKKLGRVLKNVRDRLFSLLFFKIWTVEAEQGTRERVLIPYAAAIAAGYFFVLYYHLGGG